MKQSHTRKPYWLKAPTPSGERFFLTKSIVRAHNLATVCESARCPNIGKCWSDGTATFIVMGDICTRRCEFCAVESGTPLPLDADEPSRAAQAVKEMRLDYAVITSVTRDDLADKGAGHFANTVKEIKKTNPKTVVEILVPDFDGCDSAPEILLSAEPDVVGHNIETVERLTPIVRDKRSNYFRSIKLLSEIKSRSEKTLTKSSLLLGLGETESEAISSIKDLRRAGVDILALGQYLQPTKEHYPVAEYVEPKQFEKLKNIALDMGFSAVASGPLVRSSYQAQEIYDIVRGKENDGKKN